MRAKRVGSSVVSAMTQTPASGPFGPVTVPEISLVSTARAACDATPATRINVAISRITARSFRIRTSSCFASALRPGIAQRHRAIEDGLARLRDLPVGDEVTVALELEALLGFRFAEQGLDERGDDLQRLRVHVVEIGAPPGARLR